MSPSIRILSCGRSIRRPSKFPAFPRNVLPCLRLGPRRFITAEEKPLPEAEKPGPDSNQEQLPHVSEEAAATGEIMGEAGPEISQGTPVQEVLQRDEHDQEKAPQVIKDDISNSSSLKGARSYSTSSIRRQELAMASSQASDLEARGHKFGLPELPLPSTSNLKHRYDPVVHQVTNLLMRDGKLSVAQRNMAMILNHLRTAPPPSVNPSRPLLIGAPPASHLPLKPILYLTLAIDSVAPLLRIRSQKGAAGGGVALQIPVPLGLRQRRRQSVQWILDAARKRQSRGSGRGLFAQKVAEELISIVEGNSGVWDRRGGVHKLAISARANLRLDKRR